MEIESKEGLMETRQSLKDKFPGLCTITPLSKYLAMVIFIAMPFIGAYVGYVFGLHKTIDIAETISTDHSILLSTSSPDATYKELVRVTRQKRDDLAIHTLQTCFAGEFDKSSFGFVTDGSSKPTSFKDIWWPDTYQDKSNMYFFLNMDTPEFKTTADLCTNVIKIDRDSFKALGGNYYGDINNFYFYINMNVVGFSIVDTDLKTFSLLSNGFARDTNSLFFNGYRVEGADPDTWQTIDAVYSHDAQKVYLLQFISYDALPPELRTIGGADPTSFEPIDSEVGLAKDRYHVYLADKRLDGVDPKTLRLFDFSNRLIADKAGVYIDGKHVDYLDAETFKIDTIDGLVARASDKNGSYNLIVSGADGAILRIEPM